MIRPHWQYLLRILYTICSLLVSFLDRNHPKSSVKILFLHVLLALACHNLRFGIILRSYVSGSKVGRCNEYRGLHSHPVRFVEAIAACIDSNQTQRHAYCGTYACINNSQ